MADLDAELLALADGDSSSDEGAKLASNKPDSVSSSDGSPDASASITVKKTPKAKAGASKATKARKDDSEEGEV
jgi:hypothetical protein